MNTPTTPESALSKQCRAYADAVITLAAFLAKYGDRLPDDAGLSVSIYSAKPMLSASAGYMSEENRNRLLSLVGDVFGRGGWTATPTHNFRAFNWQKELDGVCLFVHDAETLPPAPDSVPVPPSKFPIQIEDRREAE